MPSELFTVVTVAIGFFAETFLYGIVVPVLPFMLEERVLLPHDELQYYCSLLLTTYSAASLVFAPVAGAIADRVFPRKLPFLLALVIMITSVFGFFSTTSIPALILARSLQGFCTAVIWTVGFTICYNTVGPNSIGQTFGTILSLADFGAYFSPALGGIIYSQFGLTAIVAVSSLVPAAALIPAFFLDDKPVPSKTADQDETSEHTPLLASKDNTTDFILPETTNIVFQYAPILRCFRNPSLSVAIILCAIYAAQLAAFDATVPIEARKLFSFGSLDSGLLFVPIACARLLAGPLGGWMVDRFNPRFVAVLGYSLLIPVYISFRFIQSEPRQLEIGLYSLLLTLSGVCTALVATTSFVESSRLVERYHSANPDLFGHQPPIGVLNGIYLVAFGIGSSIGPMMAGSLRNSIGYGNMNAVMAGIAAFAALISFVWLGRSLSATRETAEEA